MAYVGALIVDAVVAAMTAHEQAGAADLSVVLGYVALEALLVASLAATQRGLSTCQSLLRAQLGQRVNEMILEKALTLDLRHFEDSEFYDKLTRARREASSRPLSLVMRSFGLVQNAIALLSFGTLLVRFSPWAVAVLLLAGLPSFVAEAKFSGDAFRLFRWRSPETRMQMYLETVLAREDHAKEVKLFELGPLLLERYRAIFRKVFREDRALTIRRDTWGFFLGLVSTAALLRGLCVDRRQRRARPHHARADDHVRAAVPPGPVGRVGEPGGDRRHVRGQPVPLDALRVPRHAGGRAARASRRPGPRPADGRPLRARELHVPGCRPSRPCDDVSFELRPGESLALVGENGSGKTTLIKLLTRLYSPGAGRITLDGLDLAEWEPAALRQRIGVIFQDFARYQLKVGENIGAGDVAHFEDEARWREAAGLGMAAPFIDELPAGYADAARQVVQGRPRTLRRPMAEDRAVARLHARGAPTSWCWTNRRPRWTHAPRRRSSSSSAQLASDRMVILISHRFSTVRMADQILVIEGGRVLERGSHEALMQLNGHYAQLFRCRRGATAERPVATALSPSLD